MNQLHNFTLAIIVGIVTAVYIPMNTTISKHFNSPIVANILFYLMGLISSLILFFRLEKIGILHNINTLPVHLYWPGILSACIILTITLIVPKIGARNFFSLYLTGQILAAMVISHYGILNSPIDPINIRKAIGTAILLLGGYLVVK
jgi:transporter family-2 protein